MNNVLPSDTFVVINKTIIQNDNDLLINLYQPLIGAIAISLYNTLAAYLNRAEVMSLEYTHNTLLNNMMLSCNEFMLAREKLEAIGLIKTYLKRESVNNYVYELYSPLSAKEFLDNPILNTALMNAVGEKEYERILDYFKVPNINLRNYEDITSKFSDTFVWTTTLSRNLEMYNLKNKNTRTLSIVSKIDINTILNLIPPELLNHRSLTKDMKDYLMKISFIYNYDNEAMVELIRNSLTDRHTIDKNKLKDNAIKYYQYDNAGKLPSLIYRKQPEYLRTTKDGLSNRMRMIKMFETTSPYDFLQSKYPTGTPSVSDLKIVSYLLLDLELQPGVVNVLIDYVLKINNNKLTKAFVDTIASQWKKSNIETVEDAMALAEKEYRERHNKKEMKASPKKIAKKPEWFDKDIKEDTATDEEIKAFEALLKGDKK